MRAKLNVRAMTVAAGALCSGFVIFVASSGFVRSFVGDVVVVLLLVAALASVGVGTTRSRAVGVGAFAVVAELAQASRLVGPDAHWILHLTVGSTFDPLDLLAYLLGLLLSLGAERWYEPSAHAVPRRR